MTEAAISDQSPADDAEPEPGTAGMAAAPDAASTAGTDLAEYTRVYQEHNSRLVAYAVTLTRNPSTAEDLVAEAHFRVWRRIAAGHAVQNIPAYLATTIRNLANTLHRATTEIPVPAETAEAEFGRPAATVAPDDLSQQVAHVDFVTRLLKDLPERWVHALWLSEVEDLPLETVGRRIGANSNATAVLLNRAREGLRQAFLRGYPGAPAAEACAKHWQKMPSLVRGGLSARQTDSLRGHAEQCDDCRTRLAALQQVNLRLPALLGPALLLLTLGGGSLRLFVAGAAGGAGAAKTAGAVGGARHLRHVGGKLRHGVSSGGGKAAVVSAGVLGSTAVAVAAVALTGGAAHPTAAPAQQPASQPAKSAPVARTTPSVPTPAAPKHAAASPTPAPQPSAAPIQYTPRHAAPKVSPPAPHVTPTPTATPPPAPKTTTPPPTTPTNPPVQPPTAPPTQTPVTPQPTPASTQPPATSPPPPSTTPTTPTTPPTSTPPSKPDHGTGVIIIVSPHGVTITVHIPHPTQDQDSQGQNAHGQDANSQGAAANNSAKSPG